MSAIVVIGFVLSRFAVIVDDYLRVKYSVLVEAVMVAGQVVFQWLFLWKRAWRVKGQYAVQLITVSLLGAVMLMPLVWWDWARGVSVPVALVYFFAVVGVMFADHWRRVRRLKLPGYLCATWVLYRCLLLVTILRWDMGWL